MSKYTYEEVTSPFGEKIIVRSDGAMIPLDPANSDYQTYLNLLQNEAAIDE